MLSEEHATKVPPMNDVIVTIGRENGSGGREVGSILAGMLGVKCYDRALIEATAERAGTSVDEVRSSEERRGGGTCTSEESRLPTRCSGHSPRSSWTSRPRGRACSWADAPTTC